MCTLRWESSLLLTWQIIHSFASFRPRLQSHFQRELFTTYLNTDFLFSVSASCLFFFSLHVYESATSLLMPSSLTPKWKLHESGWGQYSSSSPLHPRRVAGRVLLTFLWIPSHFCPHFCPKCSYSKQPVRAALWGELAPQAAEVQLELSAPKHRELKTGNLYSLGQ